MAENKKGINPVVAGFFGALATLTAVVLMKKENRNNLTKTAKKLHTKVKELTKKLEKRIEIISDEAEDKKKEIVKKVESLEKAVESKIKK